MGRTSKPLSRKLGNRNVRKIFVVAVEGSDTERVYFGMFSNKNVQIRTLPTDPNKPRTSPKWVLARLADYSSSDRYDKKLDELWLVVDRDSWNYNELEQVAASCKRKDYHFAVTNPKFEFWLLLHQKKATCPATAAICDTQLQKLFPEYDKVNLDLDHLANHLHEAISHAKIIDQQSKRECQNFCV